MKIKNKVFLTTIVCLTTYFTQSMEQQDNIKLESSDEQQFQVPINITEKSETIKNLIEESKKILTPTESIYLTDISGEVLGFILDLLKEDLTNQELISGRINQFKKLCESNPIFGYKFLAAVNYLDIRNLLPIAINSLGQLMKTQIKEGKKDILKYGLELIPHNLESQIGNSISSKVLNHTGIRSIESVAFSPDGKYVITGGGDCTAKLWDIETGNLIWAFGHKEFNYVTSVAFSSDGKYILTGSDDGTAKLWDVETKNAIHFFSGHDGWVISVFSPDGQSILTGSRDCARLWDVNTEKVLRTFNVSNIYSIAFSPNGRYILTGSREEAAKLWDTATGSLLQNFIGPLYSVSFSPDGQYILIGYYENVAKLWDLHGNLIHTFYHPDSVFSVTFSPNGRYILTGSGRIARLWDFNTGNLICSIPGHVDNILSVAFSPNGRYILTVSLDETTKLWNVLLLNLNLKSIVFILLYELLKNKGQVQDLLQDSYWMNIYINLPNSIKEILV